MNFFKHDMVVIFTVRTLLELIRIRSSATLKKDQWAVL